MRPSWRPIPTRIAKVPSAVMLDCGSGHRMLDSSFWQVPSGTGPSTIAALPTKPAGSAETRLVNSATARARLPGPISPVGWSADEPAGVGGGAGVAEVPAGTITGSIRAMICQPQSLSQVVLTDESVATAPDWHLFSSRTRYTAALSACGSSPPPISGKSGSAICRKPDPGAAVATGLVTCWGEIQ